MVDCGVEIRPDLLAAREVGVVRRHGEVGEVVGAARAVHVEHRPGAGAAGLFLVGPDAADAVALVEAVECDAGLAERPHRRNAADAGADDADGGVSLTGTGHAKPLSPGPNRPPPAAGPLRGGPVGMLTAMQAIWKLCGGVTGTTRDREPATVGKPTQWVAIRHSFAYSE
jgi:hypothetical protein